MTLGIVTDSTAYLDDLFIKTNLIEVIPVQLIVDGKSYADVLEFSVDQLVAALRSRQSVTTARPGVSAFLEVYQKLKKTGITQIVSIHLSSKLSGTYESALLAAKQIDIPVVVIDSKGVAGFLAQAVIDAVSMRESGKSLGDIEVQVTKNCENRKMYFYVDTLEFLARGGRVSTLKSKVGQWLTVKPILKMENGSVELHELVRTETKAMNRLIEIATEDGRDHTYAINHVDGLARANQLAEAISDTLKIEQIPVSSAGAVVGAHVGPGTVAVVID